MDYKKKYRNLKRKLKFLIYVSVGVGRLSGVRPGAGRTSVYPRVKGVGANCRRVPGSFTNRLWFKAHLDCGTGARVLPGGTKEGTEEIAEGVPGQKVRHNAPGRKGRPAGDVAPVDTFGPHPLMGPQMHVPVWGLLRGSSRPARRNKGPGEH